MDTVTQVLLCLMDSYICHSAISTVLVNACCSLTRSLYGTKYKTNHIFL